jgi:1,4-alpha-glucan branching enzyme
MKLTVHHQPIAAEAGLSWYLRAWQLSWNGNAAWDPAGTLNGPVVDVAFPDVPHPRSLSFKYRSTSASSALTVWEADDFVRQISQIPQGDVWTFAQSRRVLYQDPSPPGVLYRAGDVLTFHVITKSRFSGGRIYVWNPYLAANPSSYFGESGRDEGTGTSTFIVTLLDWMTTGFHLKLVGHDSSGKDLWEPDSSNRVWRPCDGASLWLKSGQCDVRSAPLVLTTAPVEVLLPASLTPLPTLTLNDVVEGQEFTFAVSQVRAYPDDALFNVATYLPTIYPDAPYDVQASAGETPAIVRPFPATPGFPTGPSRFALGASDWVKDLPRVVRASLSITPLARSSFTSGLSVQVAIGNAPPHQTTSAIQGADQSWTANLAVAENTTSCVRFVLAVGSEPKPYDWIDTGRYFTPPTGVATFFTTEGVFGISAQAKTSFAEPPSRAALMRAAFGPAIAGSGAFAAFEMPHGATLSGGAVYFAVHAPHAVWAALILAVKDALGNATRRQVAMTLTTDERYWWCLVASNDAPPGTPYRFLLNDTLEVLDPAAREVRDTGTFDVVFGADPGDPTTAWSLVGDVDGARAVAHTQPWQTMGWQNLLIYELHAARFTAPPVLGTLAPLDLLVDELNAVSRLGQQGYLRALPVTAFELLPVQEFNSALSWGYDPSFYFAVDGHYGGSAALARFVNKSHENGRAVLLDVVYNHSLGSSLMKIAPDVYRNGDYDGDRMNCGHPMVLEFLRQATLHMWGTFGVDGFRFDDTNTIVTKCTGGWEFLQTLRSSLRAAATAEGQAWPYCVAENSATQPWDISNPGFGVMDGQWGIDESYRIRDASYDTWNVGADDAGPLAQEANNPAYSGRPFFQAVRFGESHDMVSAQDAGNKRIAARPPFGQGLQMAKALGALTLLSNGIPMLFMGQEVGETIPFTFDSAVPPLNPQVYDAPGAPIVNARVLAWFRGLMGLRNDPSQGLQGEANYQVIGTGHRTVAFTCGVGQCLFTVVTFGTPDLEQDSSWLGLPAGSLYKEIFNSSSADFAVEFEPERTNGGYDAQIGSGAILNLPSIGAVVLQRR